MSSTLCTTGCPKGPHNHLAPPAPWEATTPEPRDEAPRWHFTETGVGQALIQPDGYELLWVSREQYQHMIRMNRLDAFVDTLNAGEEHESAARNRWKAAYEEQVTRNNALQERVSALKANASLAYRDVLELSEALGEAGARPYSMHEHIHRDLIPKARALAGTGEGATG